MIGSTALVAAMDQDEARACVSAVNRHLDGARRLLLDLYEREGWRALGYASWRECVTAEFQQSKTHLYRQLEAARVERELFSPIGETAPPLSEWHLRQIAQLPAADRREVVLALASQQDLSIKDHRRIIAHKQREVAARAGEQPIPILTTDRIPANCQAELGDARRLPLDDASAQLVVTSPPYNARVPYDGYLDWLPWEAYWQLIGDALREAYRVLCPGGRLALNLANVVRQNVPDGPAPNWVYGGKWRWRPPGALGRPWSAMVEEHLYPLVREIGFLPRERITWVKGDQPEQVTTPSTAWGTWCSAANPVLRAVAEPIWVFSKERYDRDVGVSDLAADEFKAWTRNVWFIPAAGLDSAVFPAAFPEELPRRLIKLYSYPGDLVVDPFMGSGTTLVAAARLGRWAYGCDVSERYVAIARERLAREMA